MRPPWRERLPGPDPFERTPIVRGLSPEVSSHGERGEKLRWHHRGFTPEFKTEIVQLRQRGGPAGGSAREGLRPDRDRGAGAGQAGWPGCGDPGRARLTSAERRGLASCGPRTPRGYDLAVNGARVLLGYNAREARRWAGRRGVATSRGSPLTSTDLAVPLTPAVARSSLTVWAGNAACTPGQPPRSRTSWLQPAGMRHGSTLRPCRSGKVIALGSRWGSRRSLHYQNRMG